jgi:hypothetical protein|uniref:Uncharacterized protein n=1 Tax=Siphoviridae sp. ctxvK3 TaxID=2827975 RepID=A0A8S5SGG3_9CAUD|nr:MAG TPA: hypothetical protein [Siphoviridae sp. ctxvK3]
MTDVARPCLLDCDQVASVDVVMMVNREGVVYDRRTKKDD